MSSTSASEFSCTPENLFAFNTTVSCQNAYQQQAGIDNATDHKKSLLSAGKAPLARGVALNFHPSFSKRGN